MIGIFSTQRVPGGGALFNNQGLTPVQNDTISPVLPGALTISSVSSAGFTVSWQAASDEVGVTGYELSVDRGTVAYSAYGDVLTAAVAGLLPSTQYTVRVRAYDGAGNKSTALTANATTAAAIDTTTPVLTGIIAVSSIDNSGFTVSWPAATDNVGVVDYEVSVDIGVPEFVSVGNNRTKAVTGLVSGTLYNIRVRAADASGNKSTAITTIATTSGVAPVGLSAEIISKTVETATTHQLSKLSSQPVQLTFKQGTGQEMVLFNNGDTNAVVTLKGSQAGTVTTKGLAGVTVSLAGGLPITVPARQFVVLKLDNATLYLKGIVTLTANTTDTVHAGVIQ